MHENRGSLCHQPAQKPACRTHGHTNGAREREIYMRSFIQCYYVTLGTGMYLPRERGERHALPPQRRKAKEQYIDSILSVRDPPQKPPNDTPRKTCQYVV